MQRCQGRRSNLSLRAKIEYQLIHILGKKFVWLPEILLFFEVNSLIEEVFQKYNQLSDVEILKLYTDKNVQKQVEQILLEINGLQVEIDQYRQGVILLQQQVKPLNSVEINIAHACNMRCTYCLAGDGTHGKDQFMSKENAERTIDFLFKNSGQSKNLYIAIIGGEPLINYPVFKHILEYATKRANECGKHVNFTTTVNGTLLTQDILHMLDQYQVKIMLSLDSHLRTINDTLRPMANGRSSYDMIMENAWKSMLQHPEMRGIRMTVTPRNINFYETAKAYYDAGFYHVHVEEVSSGEAEFQFNSKEREILKGEYAKLAQYIVNRIVVGAKVSCHPLLSQLLEIHQRRPKIDHCGTMKYSLGISAALDIYPCDTMMWEEYRIGNITEGIQIDNLFQDVSQSKKEHCDPCWARYLCGGGCVLKHIQAAKNKQELDCEMDLYKYALQLYIYSEIAARRPDFLERYL